MTPPSLGKVVLDVEADTSRSDKAIDATKEKASGLAGTFGKVSGAGKILTGVVGGTVVGALADFSRAAIDDEANVLKLQQAVENSGASWDDSVAAIEERIKKSQGLAVTDDETRDSIAQLTTSLGSVTKAVEAQNEIIDIARGRTISVAAATDIYQKAALGNYGALKKMGIEIDAAMTPTQALGELQKRYAGQAEGYGNSMKGAIDKVHDSVSEFTEGIGASLGPAQGVIAMLPGLRDGMSLAGGAVGMLSKVIKLTFIPSLIEMAIPFLPIIIAVGAVAIAVGLLALAWSNNWGDIQGKTKAVVGFLQDLFDGFRLLVLNVFRDIVLGVAGAINGVIGVINGFIDTYNALAEKLGLPLIGKIDLITPNLDAVDARIDQITHDRTARIFANVYEQAIAGGGGTPKYAEGTPFVPFTGPAIVHRGEAIIPANENPWNGAIDRPIVIQVPLRVHEREIAYAQATVENDSARRYGIR